MSKILYDANKLGSYILFTGMDAPRLDLTMSSVVLGLFRIIFCLFLYDETLRDGRVRQKPIYCL